MKQTFISYSQPMVSARRAGLKTQTRRGAKLNHAGRVVLKGKQWHVNDPDACLACPYGQPGDQLIVKEAAWMWCERVPNGKTPTGRDKWMYVPMREAPIHYQVDHPEKPQISVVSPDTGNQWGWRLKIPRFVPAWACRGLDEVVSIRVERLQDISEVDAIAESACGGHGSIPGYPYNATPIEHFMHIWKTINGAESLHENPWVWVVEFKVLKP